ncbi:hypothetical protein [Halalkalibacter krulwichiae]|uniref:Uncharacterized protein n=1 Tax=Halalkalibacter krulwichiae TaxID=199441 RepID=A0A1X9MEQ8_9BACI|nr:hypothetical protein [Halalkalibacter krulwichiae]ARK31918.1 hypothetical protein BkAM31D_19875 [Halalkalibacter krulwichiae]
MKIPGYRSKKRWKMGLASFGYGLLVMTILLSIMGPFTKEVADINGLEVQSEQTRPVEVLENQDGLNEEYVEDIGQIMPRFDAALRGLQVHLSQFEQNQSWIDEARGENNSVYLYASSLREFENVPSRFEEAHMFFVRGTNDIEQSHVRISESLDLLEAGNYNQAMAALKEALLFLNRGEEQMHQGYSLVEV